MDNKVFGLMVGCIAFSVICLIGLVIYMTMAKDLSNKVYILEQEIIDYKWRLEQVPYICGGNK